MFYLKLLYYDQLLIIYYVCSLDVIILTLIKILPGRVVNYLRLANYILLIIFLLLRFVFTRVGSRIVRRWVELMKVLLMIFGVVYMIKLLTTCQPQPVYMSNRADSTKFGTVSTKTK